jgi:hypothetical protein
LARRPDSPGSKSREDREAQTPEGVECVKWKGRTRRPVETASPAYREDVDDHPIAPTKPLSTSPHAGVPFRPPLRALSGCGIWSSGEGSGPRGHADERRIPRGGSLQESEYRVWPAASDPQTPTLPGTERHPDFSHRSNAT